MGITSPLENVPSVALGSSGVTPLEMVTAYAVLAAGGASVTPYAILEVRTKDDRVLYQHQDSPRRRVVSGRAVSNMNQMLQAVMTMGTGRGASLGGREAAGKTGTSQEYRDAWFIGYTADYVTGVWLGKDSNQSMKKITGGSIPARLWKDYMLVAHQGKPARSLTVDSSDWLDKLLPWDLLMGDGQSGPPSGEEGRGPRRRSGSAGGGGSLWDVIFGGDVPEGQKDGQVEYHYPRPRQ
jgi:penicillin-binding protein 1A